MSGATFALFPFPVVWGSLTTSIAFMVPCGRPPTSLSFVIRWGSPLTPLDVTVQWRLAVTPLSFIVVLIIIMDDLRWCPDFFANSFDKLLVLSIHLLKIGRILSSHLLDASHECLYMSFCCR